MSRKSRATAALLAGAILAGPLAAQDEIFADGFESGDVSAWSSAVGYLPPATVFRISDLDLRDPHLFVPLGPLCLDFTDTPVPTTDFSLNGSLAEAITTDGDGDGFLDLSLLHLFRPFDTLAEDLRFDQAGGLCTAPIDGTVCDQDPVATPQVGSYDGLADGTCLAPLDGTTSGYSPAIVEPAAPCFVTAPQTVVLDLEGLTVPLTDTQLAASWVGDPVTHLGDGLMRGFLSEEDADNLLLPPELPVVGGQPLSSLLPGGTGSCAAGDDRDVHQGTVGWWFYLNDTADRVEYLGR